MRCLNRVVDCDDSPSVTHSIPNTLFVRNTSMKHLLFAGKILFAAIAISSFSTPAAANTPVSQKPSCALGLIAKFENGNWLCRPLTLSAGQAADPTAHGLPQKPHCRLGLVAKWENGGWFCKELDIAQNPGRNPTENQSQKPTCAPGKLPKQENGQWKCETPDITSKPNTDATLLLPAVQKVR